MRGIAAFAAVFLAGGAWAADVEPAQQQNRRIHEAGSVLSEIMDAKDRSIPRDLIQKSYCVGIVPSMKRAGFIVGAKYGKGVIVCRQDNSVGWSAPSSIRVEGGNIGLQIGLGETDLIFVVMNRKGQNGLMRDRFTIGVDASAMGGPLGRETAAQTDAMMRAEILAYSRSHGIFAGIALDGATLRPDDEDNAKLYGHRVSQAEILQGKIAPPPSAEPLYRELNMFAPARTGK